MAQEFLQALTDGWSKSLASWQKSDGADVNQFSGMRFTPEKLQALQQQYVQDSLAMFDPGFLQARLAADKRFSDPAWRSNPVAMHLAAFYLLNARTLLGLVDALEADVKARGRMRFAMEQWLAAAAPSNFMAFNPQAQQKATDTQGESLDRGRENLEKDLRQGHLSMTDEQQFRVGKNLATTEGAVVFENEYFQLIEYKPRTVQVFEKPLLMVPPCINKFYILDLQASNSLVRHVLEAGQHVFMLSWRNPDASLSQATWEDYIEHAIIRAIEVVQTIAATSTIPTINVLGFCIGGTMLATALAVLAARGEKPVGCATFLTTLLDFSDCGVLDLFIDEALVEQVEKEMGRGGLMPGRSLATVFSFLRPNDLVWNYLVKNYLLGETPPAVDLLYWNTDCTNLAGPYLAWYLRNTYLENNLVKSGKLTVCGQSLDLGLVDVPVYIYGSREDHIVPVAAAYASNALLPGAKRFVMGASGHIAGVINPPYAQKRSYWLREDGVLPGTQAEWFDGATEHAGSWWPDWLEWLKAHAGGLISAPQQYGKDPYLALQAAPGSYVLAKT